MTRLGRIGEGLLIGVVVVVRIVSSQGFLHVRVEERRADGTHIRLIVPAMAVPIVLHLVPRQRLREATKDARPWLGALEAVASELAAAPDGPMVEVTDPRQRISVVKNGGSLVVDVNDPSETVHVSVPLATVRRAAGVIAERAGTN